MEILKQGVDVSKTAICPTCGCVLKYQPGEVGWGTTEVYNVPSKFWKCNGGDYGPCKVIPYQYVKCPNCECEIKL